MAAIQVGRICIKTKGREKGHRCIILDLIDKNFLLITGPEKVTGVKRRRVNVKHIQPLELAVEITRGMSDDEIIEALTRQGLMNEVQTQF